MPHLIIEYAQDLATRQQLNVMLDVVHEAAVETGLFDESHIRVRAIPVEHYRVAGKRDPFIHVQCRIHSGRTAEQKRLLSEVVLRAIGALDLAAKTLSVEVVDMDRSTYARHSA